MSKSSNVTRKNNRASVATVGTNFPKIFTTPEYIRGVNGKIEERHAQGVDYAADIYINGRSTGISAFYDMSASILENPVRFTVDGMSLDVVKDKIIDERATRQNYAVFRSYVKDYKIKRAGIDEDGNPYFGNLKDALEYRDKKK